MKSNTGLGLIKTTIERVENDKSLFASALKKLVNSSEDDLRGYLERVDWDKSGKKQSGGKKLITKTGCLQIVPDMKKLLIRALDGTRTIASANQFVFKNEFGGANGVSAEFVDSALNRPSLQTLEADMSIYKLASTTNLYWIFNSFRTDFECLWITQDQFVEFCSLYLNFISRKHFSASNDSYYHVFSLLKKDERKPAWKDNLFLAEAHISNTLIFASNKNEFNERETLKGMYSPHSKKSEHLGLGIRISAWYSKFREESELTADMGYTNFILTPQQFA